MCRSKHTKHLLLEWKLMKYNLPKSLCQSGRKLRETSLRVLWAPELPGGPAAHIVVAVPVGRVPAP